MPGPCQVCSTEPAKYRCPSCGLMSCSLACTQSHKIYCTPKAPDPTPVTIPATGTATDQGDASEHGLLAPHDERTGPVHLESLGSSKELQEIFNQHPGLRDKLREIYNLTLEAEWVSEPQSDTGRGRDRRRGAFHRGGGPGRGPWTAGKGFKRGLGKVRKWRESCEAGESVGSDAEGFMKFRALVNGDQESQQ